MCVKGISETLLSNTVPLILKEMVARSYPPSDYWRTFSWVLTLFKCLGILPVTFVRAKTDRNTPKLEIRFSRFGYVVAFSFLILTGVHTIWAPTTLLRLEKSIVRDIVDRRTANVTEILQRRTVNTKLGEVVKILHPILISLTTLSARLLSVSVLASSLPILFKALAHVDLLLLLPSKFYGENFATLIGCTAVAVSLHVPVLVCHFWEVYTYRDAWENIWEGFSMLNVFASFAFELEFVLFCLGARARFKYINEMLIAFESEEFHYDAGHGGRLKKVFSKWKAFVRPRKRRIFSGSSIKPKEQLFKLFSKMDAANGGKFSESTPKVCRIDVTLKKAPEPETSDRLASLRRGHILLFDVLHHINRLYRLHLLVSIFSSATEVMFNFYFAIFGFVHSMRVVPPHVQKGELALVTCWSLYYSFRFMLIVNVAHFTVSASKEASEIVSKIDPRKFEFSSRQEIKMFADHLSRRDFEFSACGLFNLNSSLISTSFSTGITYLVIMAQFH